MESPSFKSLRWGQIQSSGAALVQPTQPAIKHLSRPLLPRHWGSALASSPLPDFAPCFWSQRSTTCKRKLFRQKEGEQGYDNVTSLKIAIKMRQINSKDKRSWTKMPEHQTFKKKVKHSSPTPFPRVSTVKQWNRLLVATGESLLPDNFRKGPDRCLLRDLR